jgi:hypothetical protein
MIMLVKKSFLLMNISNKLISPDQQSLCSAVLSQYSSSSPKRPPISTASASSFFSSTTGLAAYAAPPVAAPAAGAFLAASRRVVASGNSYPDAALAHTKFLNAFKIECGADAAVGYPAARERLAWTPQALLNLARIDAVERSRTLASKILPF